MATDYSKTVHLPKTQFPMKGELPKREPLILELWEKNGVYKKMQQGRKASFVLHDGPPYANGHTHIGHALNKILKDMVVKSHALAGLRAPYQPGWDCHGLPIETALLKELKLDKRGVRDIPAFREKAREFAEKFIDIQRQEFRRLGVLGEWDAPYMTLKPAYEAAVLKAFRELVGKGYIYRGLKTVSWCIYCETALAEAEVEYKEKKSPSVYVALDVRAPGELGEAAALIWTTTPWTLPANMAIALHPDLDYELVEFTPAGGAAPRRVLLARSRRDAVLAKLGASKVDVRGSWKGKFLVEKMGLSATTPFGGRESKAVLADYVSAEDGTGIVHTAPGHGADDFDTGLKYGLEILSPVDPSGRFTERAGEFAGKQIFKEGNPAVIEALTASGKLLAQEEITHSYPHCWRCKNPIAFRATEQWFLSVSHDGLRKKLLQAIDSVKWIPAVGKSRISAMVQSRPDWCLSRQRVWGTPIPILFCDQCGKPAFDQAALKAIEEETGRRGSNFWFEKWGETVDAKAWPFLPAGLKCACGGERFRRETDILDVWVDSGASWLAVLSPRGEAPCDLYLEGSDQHRGWFQSSLVLSTALTGQAPYKSVLTHGFVLDDQGRAMHKSLGNVVSPSEVIDKLGADVLRLWVALADYSDDVRLSAKLLEGPTEAYRKLRNTLRYLLGNLCDFDPQKRVAPDQWSDMDRYIAHRFSQVGGAARKAYEEYRFRDAAKALVDFCNLDLSSFYLDACKDKLYTLASDAVERRAAQTVMFDCLSGLIRLLAPVVSYTAEEAWQELRRLLQEAGSAHALEESVFLAEFPAPADNSWDAALEDRWKAVLDVRALVYKAIEEKRAAGGLGSSLQAKVRLSGQAARAAVLDEYRERWPEILLVSQVELKPGAQPLAVEVAKADGAKCARCWRYQTDVGQDAQQPELCGRCIRQLS